VGSGLIFSLFYLESRFSAALFLSIEDNFRKTVGINPSLRNALRILGKAIMFSAWI
jgi:hypothetical protein